LFQRVQEKAVTKNETDYNNRQYSYDHQGSYLSSGFNHSISNIEVKRSLSSNIPFNFANIQTKLKLSQPGDVYEQEAERVAEEIIGTSSTKTEFLGELDRKCKTCEDSNEEEISIGRKETRNISNLETLVI
jgi:superfamily I DNA and/or RNA helicase